MVALAVLSLILDMPSVPRPAAAVDWCITINNPTDPEDVLQSLYDTGRFVYIIGQLETGENSTPHIQAFCTLKQKHRLSTMKKIPGLIRAHLEKRRGTRVQAIHYCKKPVLRCECVHCKDCSPSLDGPWEYGLLPTGQGHRSDLDEVYDMLADGKTDVEILNRFPGTFMRNTRGIDRVRYALSPPRDSSNPPSVILIYGPPGTGKSRYVWDAHPLSDIWATGLDGLKWFDGYVGQPVALLEEFHGDCTLPQLLRILDRHPLRSPVKGAYTQWRPDTIYLCTNIHPSDWYNYSGREVHYIALSRRITSVVLSRDTPFTVFRNGDDAFNCFFLRPLRLTPRGNRFQLPPLPRHLDFRVNPL